MSWLKRVFSNGTTVAATAEKTPPPEELNEFGEEPSGVHEMTIAHIDGTIDHLKDFRAKLKDDLAQIRRGKMKVMDGGGGE